MKKVKSITRGTQIIKNKKSYTIQIAFTYLGVECKERFNFPLEINIKFAERQISAKRDEVLKAIEKNEFVYSNFFPNSRKRFKFNNVDSCHKITIGYLLNLKLADYERMNKKNNLASSTRSGYIKIVNSLKQHFNDIEVSEFSYEHLYKWLEHNSELNVTSKTLRNRINLLKDALNEGIKRSYIKNNILMELDLRKEITKYGRKSDFAINPFTPNEQIELLKACDNNQQMQNLIQFNLNAGLRISELIELKWKDIDFEQETIAITRARIGDEVKTPKTTAGNRTIIMLPAAKRALMSQQLLTGDNNNQYVFLNPKKNKRWSNSNELAKSWRLIINNSNLEYRNIYQLRHTYASTMLSNGENQLWLIEQMGHTSIEMLAKHYSKWIKQNVKNGYKFVGNYK